MRAKRKTAIQLFARKDIRHDPVHHKVCRSIQASRKQYSEEQEERKKAVEKQRKLSLQTEKLESMKKAKEVLNRAENNAS